MKKKVYWQPSSASLQQSQMQQFMNLAQKEFHQSWKSYESFHDWSVEHFEDFWSSYLEYSGILYEGILEPAYVGAHKGTFWGGEWFKNIQLNYAENLLSGVLSNTEALVGLDEVGRRRAVSGKELHELVSLVQQYLKAQGVSKGDRVAALVPNTPESVIAMLATSSLGAIWTSCSPDFGVRGVLDRFSQVEPKVLFVSDATFYNGKWIDLSQKNSEIASRLPSLCAHFTFSFRGGEMFSELKNQYSPRDIEYLKQKFSDPLFIMYSSGTTGVPKCMVHGVGGTLLQHKKELQLHCNLKSQDKIFYYTTCGWMMWNWLVSALSVGATVYCYEGSPFAPTADTLWQMVDKEKIHYFGTSAKFIHTCLMQNLKVKEHFSLSQLKAVLSTGSPLLAEDFDYFYQECVSTPIPLQSISGGTDILSCFVLGCPLKPVIRGEIQCRGLGMDVQAWSERGDVQAPNETGELVCANPFPSMPLSFWKDADFEKYKKSYFERFPGVWAHGDYIAFTENQGAVIYGRSDTTLNPSGVRIGTAEIYRYADSSPAVEDSLAVGQKWQGDERMVLFVKLKSGSAPLNEEICADIKKRIREGASPRHVPSLIIEVADIPYTLSGKKVEKAVSQIINGQNPEILRDTFRNPEAIDFYFALACDCEDLKK